MLCFIFAGITLCGQMDGAMQAERIQITAKPLAGRPVDIKQGGQFIEPLCGLIPTMLAQQVACDSFEEEPPYKVSYKADIDKPFRPWYPDGAVHKASYSFDTDNPFNGVRSQKVEIKERCHAGISQDGFYLKDGLQYTLRMHVRSDCGMPVLVSLHGDGKMIVAPTEAGTAGLEWTPVEVKLKSNHSTNNATLSILGDGPGTFWVDRVSFIAEDAVLGIWRSDVIDALKAMNPGIVRWGGSTTEGYEWEQCIGPWDKRVPFTTCWGGLEPNFVGMEEFVQLCQYINAEPMLCIRWSGKTPEDAAAQVEYFNGSPDSPWGQKRASNGHAKPYAVKYWQIGNEVGGEKYDASVHAFSEAMRKADPSIKILSAFFNDETLAKGGDYLDYLCPHHYECNKYAAKDEDFKHIQELIARDGHGRDVRVAVTEWNTTAGDWGLGRGMLQTLANALDCSRYQNLMHRYADLVEISIRSNMADSFGSGIIQAGPGWMYVAPEYYAQQLYQRAAGSHPLEIVRSGSTPWPDVQPDLSALASADEKMIRIYAVNSSTEPKKMAFDASAYPDISSMEAFVLNDSRNEGTGEVMNTRDEPKRISIESKEKAVANGNLIEYELTPLSLTLLEAHIK